MCFDPWPPGFQVNKRNLNVDYLKAKRNGALVLLPFMSFVSSQVFVLDEADELMSRGFKDRKRKDMFVVVQ